MRLSASASNAEEHEGAQEQHGVGLATVGLAAADGHAEVARDARGLRLRSAASPWSVRLTTLPSDE